MRSPFDTAHFTLQLDNGGYAIPRFVTHSERKDWSKTVQPGSREWVTIVNGVNSQRQAIPAFVTFVAKVCHEALFLLGLPEKRQIAIRDTAWTERVVIHKCE